MSTLRRAAATASRWGLSRLIADAELVVSDSLNLANCSCDPFCLG